MGIDGFLNFSQTSRIQGIFLERHSSLTFLTVGTKHTICMADNWFAHAMKATAQPSLFVYVALDKESYFFCADIAMKNYIHFRKHTIECVDFSDVLPWSELKSQSVVGFGSCIYTIITWMKPLILKVA